MIILNKHKKSNPGVKLGTPPISSFITHLTVLQIKRIKSAVAAWNGQRPKNAFTITYGLLVFKPLC